MNFGNATVRPAPYDSRRRGPGNAQEVEAIMNTKDFREKR